MTLERREVLLTAETTAVGSTHGTEAEDLCEEASVDPADSMPRGLTQSNSLRNILEEVLGPALRLSLRQVLWEELESELRKVLREELERSSARGISRSSFPLLASKRAMNNPPPPLNLGAPASGSDESQPSSPCKANLVGSTTPSNSVRDADEPSKTGLQEWLAQRGMDAPLTADMASKLAECRSSAPPSIGSRRLSSSVTPPKTPDKSETPSGKYRAQCPGPSDHEEEARALRHTRGLRVRVEPPSSNEVPVPRRAHMIGVVPAATSAQSEKQVGRQASSSKRDRARNPNLKCLEQQLANELFQANDLLPTADAPPAKKFTERMSSFSNISGGRLSFHRARGGGKTSVMSNDRHASKTGADKPNRISFGAGGSPSLSPSSSMGSFQSALPLDLSAQFTQLDSEPPGDLATGGISPGEAGNPYVVDIGEATLPHQSSSGVISVASPLSKRVPTCGELRRMQDQRLTSHLSTLEHLSTSDSEGPDGCPPNLEGLSRHLSRLVTTITGVVPWSDQWLCMSVVYQWSILIMMVLTTFSATYRTYVNWKLGNVDMTFLLAQDCIIAVGALLSLLGCQVFWRSKGLMEASRLLKAYSSKVDAPEEWDEVSYLDLLCSLGLWLLSILLSVVVMVTAGAQVPSFGIVSDHASWGHIIRFTYSSAVLMGICQYLLHLCQCLSKLVETFCYQAIEQPDFTRALHNWSLLQALCRTACSSIQFAFLALQATATALGLLSIVQVVNMDTTRFMGSIPALVVAASVFRTSIWAAAVTDKCLRVPMLVNSVSVGVDLDPDRLYVVQYIEHSQAGFYLFELRLTSATVLKTAYVACAGCFFLAARLL